MIGPIPGADAFRTESVDALPDVALEFDEPDSHARSNCTLILYDERGIGGVLGELMPALVVGLHEALNQGGQQGAKAYFDALAAILRSESRGDSPFVVQGLWAELLVIEVSQDTERLIEAWHRDPEDRYDFAFANERLEIKSTSGVGRLHHFSSSQLPPDPGILLTVISIRAERVAGGESISRLLRRIEPRVSTTAFARLVQGVLSTVSIDSLASHQYDRSLAISSELHLDGRNVPTLHLPSRVNFANWTADLDGLEALASPLGGLGAVARVRAGAISEDVE